MKLHASFQKIRLDRVEVLDGRFEEVLIRPLKNVPMISRLVRPGIRNGEKSKRDLGELL